MKISAEYFAWFLQCRWYVWRIWTQEFMYFLLKLIRFPLNFLALVYKIGAFFLLIVHEQILMKICAHFVRKWSISCRLLRCTRTHKKYSWFQIFSSEFYSAGNEDEHSTAQHKRNLKHFIIKYFSVITFFA